MKKFFSGSDQSSIEVPPWLPVQSLKGASINQSLIKKVGKACKASQAEVAVNPRARSAVLRIGEKLVGP